MMVTDELDAGQQPRCPTCGTVMHQVDGGYQCRWCGHEVDIPWVEHPAADELPGIGGG